ncbi:putative Ig domain-containing protein [Acidovorax sp. ACV01]|uniref:putative Ig domain-containing protein n=1 Tax=Acidovorax sp. ACV01 TaxID=2769311 RepID=UPI00177E0C6E|nr:putative Ig domain-containing protein [Acidovorax sp. ACV01]MBD9393466.1 putative Ig domain-containing protein [Acidovorax sp. ACV01]
MLKKVKFLMLAVAAALSACGGGGGNPGQTDENYAITLRTEKVTLPVNVGSYPAGIGVYAPFTTTLYVNATKGGAPIPGGPNIFGCNTEYGLGSGPLYYLDGDPAHEDDDGNPLAFRSITLGANSGGNSFHFHAGNQAGTATITCSVTDPRSGRVERASVNITVGAGAATGKPASVRVIAQTPEFERLGYLGTKSNPNRIINQVGMQALVLDDGNQPTPDGSGAKVQIRILAGTEAAVGARLVSGNQSGSILQLSSIGGVALFSLLSGEETGPIFMEFTTDRFDNNVANGIQDPISIIEQISVIEGVTTPINFTDVDLGTVTKGVPFTSLLTVSGGLPPFVWSVTGLPAGLSVDASTGMLSGTVSSTAEERDYRATVAVVDKNKLSTTGTIKLKVVGGLPEDFAIGDCNSNAVCSLGSAPVGTSFTYSFVASVSDVTWRFTSLPAWLTSGTTGSAGVLNGTPKVNNCGSQRFLVTATKGSASITRTFSITVVTGATPPGGDPIEYTCP